MPDMTADLMFEVLKSIQARLTQVDGKIDEMKQEMLALRTSQNAARQEITSVFQEISGVHATLVRHEGRLDRIERRLELHDALCGEVGPASQPSNAAEAPVERDARNQHQAQHGIIAVVPLELRHVLEVHAVDAG